MTSIYLKSFLLIGVLFAALSVTARALGKTQPPNPAVIGFVEGCRDKPQPCWFGVMPGVTTIDELYQLLNFIKVPRTRNILSQGFALVFTLPQPWPYCHAIFNIRDNVVVRGEISLCRQPIIRVGDLAALTADSPPGISLPPEELIYGALALNVKGWVELTNHVTYITLLAPDAQYPHYPWHGYVLKERYCQFVHNYPSCR